MEGRIMKIEPNDIEVVLAFAGGIVCGILCCWDELHYAKYMRKGVATLRQTISQSYKSKEDLCDTVLTYSSEAIKDWTKEQKIEFYKELSAVADSEANELSWIDEVTR
jgi:hypothetical protein